MVWTDSTTGARTELLVFDPWQIPADGQCHPSPSWWGYIVLVLFGEPTFGGFCSFWVRLSDV